MNMKKIYRYIAGAAVAAASIACIELTGFMHPDTAPINSEVNVSMQLEVNCNYDFGVEGSTNSQIMVAILAPESWNITENATVTYTSTDIPGGPVTDGAMRLATDADVNDNNETYISFVEKLGKFGNYEPVEWVVFLSEEMYSFKTGNQFSGTVNIKFTTGNENIRTNLAYFVGETYSNTTEKAYHLEQKIFETTGGTDPVNDYTVPKMWSISPSAFTWEDIVSFVYDVNIEVDDEPSALKDEEAIYFISTAYYDGGQTVTIDETTDKTLMLNDENYRKKYMYPHEYYGIPADKKIERITFYVTNKDKSITVKNPDGSEFELAENDI